MDTDDGDRGPVEIDFMVDLFGYSTAANALPCNMDVSDFLLAMRVCGLFTVEGFWHSSVVDSNLTTAGFFLNDNRSPQKAIELAVNKPESDSERRPLDKADGGIPENKL